MERENMTVRVIDGCGWQLWGDGVPLGNCRFHGESIDRPEIDLKLAVAGYERVSEYKFFRRFPGRVYADVRKIPAQ